MESAELIELPVLERKEEEERKGGAIPLPFLMSPNGALPLAGASLQMGRAGLAAGGLAGGRGLTTALGGSSLPVTAALLAPLAGMLLYMVGSNRAPDSSGLVHWGFLEREAERPASRPAAQISGLELIPERIREQEQIRLADEKAPAKPAAGAEPAVDAPAAKLERVALPAKADGIAAARPAGRLSEGLGKNFGREGGGSRAAGATMGASSGATLALRDAAARAVKAASASSSATPFSRNRQPARAGRRAAQANGARNAVGQLRIAQNFSSAANRQGQADSARGFAADAFDGISSADQASGTISVPGADALPPLGSGAPDLTSASSFAGRNVTPFQKQVDDAKKDTGKAKQMMILGAMLLALGAALIAAGIKKLQAAQALDPVIAIIKSTAAMGSPFAAAKLPIVQAEQAALIASGQKLLAAGAAAMAAGAMAIALGLMAAQNAKQGGQDIDRKHQQPEQREAIEDCANQALAKQECQRAPFEQPQSTVAEDVRRMASPLQGLENGGPIGGPIGAPAPALAGRL